MQTALPRLEIPLAGLSMRLLPALLQQWQGWRERRQRVAADSALLDLPPRVLDDIGLPPDWREAAACRREQRRFELDSLRRGQWPTGW